MITVGFISGILVAGYAVIALFFLRFWVQSRDRLFVFFSAAFAILALQRTMLALWHPDGAGSVFLYVVRLLAFVLIVYAIVDKNRAEGVGL